MPPTSLRVKVRFPYGGQQGSRPSGPSGPLMSPTASSSPAPLMSGTIPSQNFSTLIPTPGPLFQTRCLPGFFHSCHPLHEDFLDHCSWRSLRWVQGITRRTHRTRKTPALMILVYYSKIKRHMGPSPGETRHEHPVDLSQRSRIDSTYFAQQQRATTRTEDCPPGKST